MQNFSDQEFIPYLVLVRFAKGDEADLRERVKESLPLMGSALAEIGTVHQALLSYDGSVAAYFLAANGDVKASRVIEQLQSPRSRTSSPLQIRDQVLVISVETGIAHRLERAEDWLNKYGLLTD